MLGKCGFLINLGFCILFLLMTGKKNFLQSTLAKESRAYGFTIAFWGSGIMLINFNGIPSALEAVTFGFGAVFGFGLLTIYLYRNAFEEIKEKQDSKIAVLSMVHYIASLVPMIAAYFIALYLPGLYAFFLTGAATSILYNLGMVVEENLSEKMIKHYNN